MVSWGPPTGATPDPIIDRALALHRSRLAASKLDRWPDVWAGHYAADRVLGEVIASLTDDISQVLFDVGLPFCCPETTDSVLVWSQPQNQPDDEAAFLVVHLDSDHHTESYRMGYQILPGGIMVYDTPVQYSVWDPLVNAAVLTLLNNKSTYEANFDETMAAMLGKS